MSKKTFTLVIVIVLAIIGFTAWWIFNSPVKAPKIQNPDSSGTNLFPFGQGAVNPNQPKATSTTSSGNSNQVVDLSGSNNVARLRRLSADPSVGGAFVQISSSTLAIRFIDRATGHINQSAVDSSVQSKISNVTIPQIREALWDTKGNAVIYRYLKDDSTLQSFSAVIKQNGATSSQPIEGIFLPTAISSMALAGGKVLYFDPSADTGRLILANSDGSKKSTVWTSSFGEWAVSSNNPAKAFVYTKPSGTANGVGYLIDTAKGTGTQVIGDVAGLEGTINPSGDYVFLSAAQNSGIASAVYSVAKKTVTQLSLGTLALKCTWSNKTKNIIYCGVPAGVTSGTYPDDWYKGSVGFSDRLWQINVETGETTVLLDPFVETVTNYDMTNLVIDPSDSYISFVNKNDLTIWLYKIK